jgi:hypothetical protein
MLAVGFHENINHAIYHADPCERPSLSAHTAITLLSRSPSHAYCYHPRLGGVTKQLDTEAVGTGLLTHALLLGGGQKIVEVDAPDWRTKAAKEARDAAASAGDIAVLAHKLGKAKEIAKFARGWFPATVEECYTEATIIWQSDGVLCRGRADAWHKESATIIDLKTTEDANAAASGGSIVRWGYDIQAAAYVEGFESLFPELAGRIKYLLYFVEVDQPYQHVTAELDGELMALGSRKWKRAKAIWQDCLARDNWPGPQQTGVRRIECPAWASLQDMDQQLKNMEAKSSNDQPF